jgi:hypothetical protein
VRITNELNLPEPLVRAITNDGYSRGESDFSVTQLIAPARARVLRKRHSHLITEDASDRIYSLLGQAIHTILERAEITAKVEERLFAKVDGLTISGQFDRMVLIENEDNSHTLQDWKLSSIWAVADGYKVEWEQQLNMLRWLAEANDLDVSRLQIIAIFRDWSRSRAKRDPSYPQHQVKVIDIPLWTLDRAYDFIRERLAAHVDAELGELPDCTPEERWYRGEQWAVMKAGNKRAVKLHEFKNEAEKHAAELQAEAKPGAKFVVEHRPGENGRCADYCAAYAFCKQAHA